MEYRHQYVQPLELKINSLKGHSVAPLALSGFLKIEGGEIGPNLGYFDKITHRH